MLNINRILIIVPTTEAAAEQLAALARQGINANLVRILVKPPRPAGPPPPPPPTTAKGRRR